MAKISETPFMTFWRGVNAARRDLGLSALLYGDARDLYAIDCAASALSGLRLVVGTPNPIAITTPKLRAQGRGE